MAIKVVDRGIIMDSIFKRPEDGTIYLIPGEEGIGTDVFIFGYKFLPGIEHFNMKDAENDDGTDMYFKSTSNVSYVSKMLGIVFK